MMPRAAFQICDVVAALHRCRAFESVMIKGRTVVLSTPFRVKVIERNRNVVGVWVARAKDDGLLLRPARGEKLVEQVLRHHAHALFNDYAALEAGRRVTLAYLRCAQRLARG